MFSQNCVKGKLGYCLAKFLTDEQKKQSMNIHKGMLTSLAVFLFALKYLELTVMQTMSHQCCNSFKGLFQAFACRGTKRARLPLYSSFTRVCIQTRCLRQGTRGGKIAFREMRAKYFA